ncbi:leucine-rich repeat : Leucine-rich repeat protein, putative OS=Trypanosoma vivax (strain Y486) GN=TvY486_0039050 PE=4 SV=1: LRR_7: Ras [Gemmata massiliana]|uniref:Roc domain-containing protein n=1 Tax=Gemmata massiliana TaxID=1210884 RepID=A0A6P2CVG2_9BACT|nr:ADP-ribosylation factor-like protein [Gemmata massiliana]VTR92893.1 leucine-rich repeat : Leucine-rich repeat protein, putative OS=Trypanosoma vivax (strain Y486) GN=TvY486_0039050 PE=4 SV=1: LRR_7: Ras [Gemmata massiliana]
MTTTYCKLSKELQPNKVRTPWGQRCLELNTDNRLEWKWDSDRSTPSFADVGLLINFTWLTTLSLSGCKSVADLEPLRELRALTTLKLSWCESVTDLEPLRELRALTTLDLSGCESVTNLGLLRELRTLTALELTGCQSVADLEPLRELQALTTLKLSWCESVADLEPLRELQGLTTLDLYGCQSVVDLRPLRELRALTTLKLSWCESVANLEPLRELRALTTLELSGCQSVADLEPLLNLSFLETLHVDGTAVSVPDYLRGESDARAILAWLRGEQYTSDESPLGELKLLLVGQGRVGKTHLRQRLFKLNNLGYYDREEQSTPHIDFTEKTLTLPANHATRLREVKLRVWDFGGQNELHSVHRFFLGAQRCFYILVLAAYRPANGDSSESNRLNYWLRLIARSGRSSQGRRAPVLVVITQSDHPKAAEFREQLERALEVAETEEWFGANVVKIIRGFGWSGDLKKHINIEIWNGHQEAARAINAAIEANLRHVPDLEAGVPIVYHRAKAFVEAAFAGDDLHLRAYLADEDLKRFARLFENLAGHDTRDQRQQFQNNCLRLLDSLGVAHWIGDVPGISRSNPWKVRDVVFNPEWVRHPLYELAWRRETAPPRRVVRVR